MEVGTLMEEETPSWLSIITKARRFTAVTVQSNNEISQQEQEGQASLSRDVVNAFGGGGHQKKGRRHRQISLSNSKVLLEVEEDRHRHISPRKIAVIDGPINSECSSTNSPSPGLLSSGSVSSAEDDASSVSTSASTLSAFSCSSPSPKQFTGVNMPRSYQDLLLLDEDNRSSSQSHPGDRNNVGYTTIGFRPHNFQDFRERRQPEISISPLPLSNQISVIKSTRSFLRSDRNDDNTEEPQDLSIKPKRFIASSYTPRTEPNFSPPKLNVEEKCCVQDLSARVPNSFNNTSSVKITSMPNNRTDKAIIFNSNIKHPHEEQSLQKVVNASSLSCYPASDSPSKFESSDDSTSSVGTFFNPVKSKANNSSVNNDEEGEMVIVDVSSNFKAGNTFYGRNGVELPSAKPHINFPQTKYSLPPISMPTYMNTHTLTNGKIQDLNNDSTKEAETEVEVEMEINKSRRGRKRKDDEAIGTKFECFLCNFTCVKENVLKNHMVRMHTVKGNRGNVKCTVCGYACPTLDELRSHQELIHGQASKDEGGSSSESKVAFHACPHCSKKFRSQSQLEAHLRLIKQKLKWKDLKTNGMMS